MKSVRFTRHQALLVLAACLLGHLSTVGAALPYPILPPLFVGATPGPISAFLGLPVKLLFGIALAVNPLGLLIGASLLGPFSDRHGRRSTLLVTAFGAAFGHALSAWALVAGSYPLFVLARFATGLAEGNASVARAMLADQIDGPARNQAFAWFNSALYLGWLVGPLLAGITLGFGVVVPFAVAAVALVISGALTRLVLAADRPARPAAGGGWRVLFQQQALGLLADPQVRRVFVPQFLFTLGLTAFYEFYPVWLVEIPGMDTRGIAWVTAILCLVMSGASVLAGRLRPRVPMASSALAALVSAGCFLMVALSGARLGLVAIVFAGLPISLYNALVQAEVSRRFGDTHGQGAIMGLVSTVFCISNLLAALVGAVIAVLDTRAILALGAACSLLAAVQLGRLSRRDRLDQSTCVTSMKSGSSA